MWESFEDLNIFPGRIISTESWLMGSVQELHFYVYGCGGLIAMLTLAQGFTFTSDVFLLNAWTSEEKTCLPLMNGFLE